MVSSVCSLVLHTHKRRCLFCCSFCCAHSQMSLSPLFNLSFCILTNFALVLFLCVHTYKLRSLGPLFFFLHTRGLRYLFCCVCTLTNSVVCSVVFAHSQTSLSPLLFFHTRKLHCLLCYVCTITNIVVSSVVFAHTQTSFSPLLCLHSHTLLFYPVAPCFCIIYTQCFIALKCSKKLRAFRLRSQARLQKVTHLHRINRTGYGTNLFSPVSESLRQQPNIDPASNERISRLTPFISRTCIAVASTTG